MILSHSFLNAQYWEKTYGETGADVCEAILETSDGGFILVGSSNSFNNQQDIYAVKIDMDGSVQWEQTYGLDTYSDFGQDIIQSSDGNFLIASTAINNEDISFASILKIDPSGSEIFLQYSSTDSINAKSITETPDGNIFMTGDISRTILDDQDLPVNDFDLLIFKANEQGEEIWSKNFGGEGLENGYEILTDSNNNITAIGLTNSIGSGETDSYWLNIDQEGNLLSERSHGSELTETAFSFAAVAGGGYIVAGYSLNTFMEQEVVLIKTAEDGTGEWVRSYILPGSQEARDIIALNNGNYLITGFTEVDGNRDLLAILTDPDGTMIWAKTFGGLENENGKQVIELQNSVEGFAFIGNTQSYGAGGLDFYVVKSNANGVSLSNSISGVVYIDSNNNCIQDEDENGIPNVIISANGLVDYLGASNENGEYIIPVDTGDYLVHIISTLNYWDPCIDSLLVSIENEPTRDTIDFGMQSNVECPLLTVDVSTPFLRRCFDNTYSVTYCNNGTIPASSIELSLDFDIDLNPLSSSIPWSAQAGNTFFFELDDLEPFECNTFQVIANLNCAGTTIGETHCVSAHITPDTICMPEGIELWDGSSIAVDGVCQGDSVLITVSNNGDDMDNIQSYIIIEDHIVFTVGGLQLPGFSDTLLVIEPGGSTIRFEMEQSLGHPGLSRPSVVLEGCGEGPYSLGHVLELPFDDNNPSDDIECQESIGSFDPNDKKAEPKGYQEEHYLAQNTGLEYLIRFQNTGTDTAFNIIIRDTLSSWLDMGTLHRGTSSHFYDLEVLSGGILKFSFNNIHLPDSNINEAASHGFVKFKIDQKKDNPIGTTINNRAAIYFDFNEPIITNETFHLIGNNFVEIDPTTSNKNPKINEEELSVYPNPFSDLVYFDLKDRIFDSGSLLILNSQSAIISQKTFTTPIVEFRPENLPAGIYFFTIILDEKRTWSGKIVLL